MMISKEQFLAIKKCQSEGMSMAAAAKQIGISVQTLADKISSDSQLIRLS